jgi:hypothetical protein
MILPQSHDGLPHPLPDLKRGQVLFEYSAQFTLLVISCQCRDFMQGQVIVSTACEDYDKTRICLADRSEECRFLTS